MKYNIPKHIAEDSGIVCHEDYDLSKISTFKLAGQGQFIEVRKIDSLVKLVQFLGKGNIPYVMIGLGANQIVPKNPNFIYIKLILEIDKEILAEPRDQYVLPASTPLSILTSHAQKFGVKGWQVFTGIPATLGGAICMNAGTQLGEIGSLIKYVEIIDKNGALKKIDLGPNSFVYRNNTFLNPGDIIVSVCITSQGYGDPAIKGIIKDYLNHRNKTQPMSAKTCGCVFKNALFNGSPCAAGKFIDIIDLKGLTINHAKVSHKHGNFIENQANASEEDVKALIRVLKDELLLGFGVEFHTEVKYFENL